MEQNGIWSEDLKIRAFMVDRNREANLVAIQNMCQEVAGNHANFRRLGFEDMQAQGLAWVLNRLKIKVLQFPKWTETVTVKTWVSQMSPFSHRHFQILLSNSDENDANTVEERNPDTIGKGVVLANVYTIWIPIDMVTKRPKRQVLSDLPLKEMVYDCEIPEKLGFTVEERNPDTVGKGCVSIMPNMWSGCSMIFLEIIKIKSLRY
jgi:acyl-CoA thioesterase FadM